MGSRCEPSAGQSLDKKSIASKLNTTSIVVVVLIAVGVVVLASLSLSFLTPGKPVEFLGLNIATGDGQFIPPVAGGLALALGIITLVVKSKRAG